MKQVLTSGLSTILLLAGLSATTQAQETGPNIVGKYSTVIVLDGLPQPIFFDIKSLRPGDKEALLTNYSPQRNCSARSSYGGFVGGSHFFYVVEHGCGHIGRQSHFKLSVNSNGELLYELVNEKGVIETGLLKKG
ncbi:MAG: hypothetical protein JNK21_04055 [Rhodospirillaceae bacterium]|nr:hypothetical protein [Rhodospirillaceae bacterium]